MNLGDAIWMIVKGLWWLPLPFLFGKGLVIFCKAWGRVRNQR